MDKLKPMLEATGWKVSKYNGTQANTVFIHKSPGLCTWISATCRNGGRGVWLNGKRVVVPNTKGRGWRERFVKWLNSPAAARKMRRG